jgi:hypothetical protein
MPLVEPVTTADRVARRMRAELRFDGVALGENRAAIQ